MPNPNEYVVLVFPEEKASFMVAARVLTSRKYRFDYGPVPTSENKVPSGSTSPFAIPWPLTEAPGVEAQITNMFYFDDSRRLMLVTLDDGLTGPIAVYGKTNGTSTTGDFSLTSPLFSSSVSEINIECDLVFKLWSIKVFALDQETTIYLNFKKEDDTSWNSIPIAKVAAGEEYEILYRKPIILKAPGLRDSTTKAAKKLQIKFSWEQATAGTASIEASISIGEESLGDNPLRWYLAYGTKTIATYTDRFFGSVGTPLDYLKPPFQFFVLPKMTGSLQPRFGIYNPTNISFYTQLTFNIEEMVVEWIKDPVRLYKLMTRKLPATWISGHELIDWLRSYPFYENLGVRPVPVLPVDTPEETGVKTIKRFLTEEWY